MKSALVIVTANESYYLCDIRSTFHQLKISRTKVIKFVSSQSHSILTTQQDSICYRVLSHSQQHSNKLMYLSLFRYNAQIKQINRYPLPPYGDTSNISPYIMRLWSFIQDLT